MRPKQRMLENERRASPRFKAKPGRKAFYAEGSWAIRDSSVDGVFVLARHPFSVGTRIDFSLHFGAQNMPLQGIVRRSVAREGMAIQFVTISPEARTRLQSYVFETNGSTVLGWLKKKRFEKLSRTLRMHARTVRGHDPQAFVFNPKQLAALLGKNSGRIDEVLEFMRERGWSGEDVARDAWWIL